MADRYGTAGCGRGLRAIGDTDRGTACGDPVDANSRDCCDSYYRAPVGHRQSDDSGTACHRQSDDSGTACHRCTHA